MWMMIFFGLRAAPLIWCRFAAALCRLLQAVMPPGRARLQCYIGDFLLRLKGRRTERDYDLSLFVFLLTAFGVNLSWKKLRRGEARRVDKGSWCGLHASRARWSSP